MSEAPYIPFYTSDFLGGTSGMTSATKGVYITLLCLMYEGEAPLHQSWDALARRSGCTLPAFRRAVEALVEDGKVTISNGVLWSEKCEKHITQRRERSSSAKAAAKTRWEKTKQNQHEDDANALRAECQPEPEPESYKNTHQNDELFSAFWDVYPRHVGKKPARLKFDSAIKKGASGRDIISAAKAYAGWLAEKGKGFRPEPKHPEVWLNKECWNDELPGAARPVEVSRLQGMFDRAMASGNLSDAERIRSQMVGVENA